ncbi:hypothetical protein SteCoe_32249 [Stentor coeruleus]|uniref:Uncharacterized protein n=1 Tax=Stentor coeruleus TaxID=5963 RepID=A0A1R2AZE0_9CILI|nr:hypothetical protein SteCoe_32249 [Stentor coeruleus]
MGSCSACIAKSHKNQYKSTVNLESGQLILVNEEVKESGNLVLVNEEVKELGLKRAYTIGPPIPNVPDHPMATYTFPRSNTANFK